MAVWSDSQALSVFVDYVFENKDRIGGDISLVKDKNGILDFVLERRDKTEQGENQAVEIDIKALLDSVKEDFNRYGYGKRFDRTATTKKVKSALTSKDKNKKLYPFEIAYAYKCYLRECFTNGTDSTYVKLASSFMTNMVYDFAEREKAVFEQKMVEKYGEKWRKVKFVFV